MFLIARIFGKTIVEYEISPNSLLITTNVYFVFLGKRYKLSHTDGTLWKSIKNALKREKELADAYLAKVKAENDDK